MTRSFSLATIALIAATACAPSTAPSTAPNQVSTPSQAAPSSASAPLPPAPIAVAPSASASSQAPVTPSAAPLASATPPSSECAAIVALREPCALLAAFAKHLESGAPACAWPRHSGSVVTDLFPMDEYASADCYDKPSTGACRQRPVAGPSLECVVQVPAKHKPMDYGAMQRLLKRCTAQDKAEPFHDSDPGNEVNGIAAKRSLGPGRLLVSELCDSPYDTGNFTDSDQPIIDTVYSFEMFIATVSPDDHRASPWVK